MSQEIIRNHKCLRQRFFSFLDNLTIDSLATHDVKADLFVSLKTPSSKSLPSSTSGQLDCDWN